MAKYARLGFPGGTRKAASEIFSRNAKLYCDNDGCSAPMVIVSMSEDSAHFRSKKRSDHRYPICLRSDVVFNPDDYDEGLFDIGSFASSVLSGGTPRGPYGGGGGGSVGRGRSIAIGTIRQLYAAMLDRGYRRPVRQLLLFRRVLHR